ncbi:hypothetical protein C0Z19_19285 [Trinickia soli]|uniref:Uncharacterized protein n=1 Tax=Trinickia soli TaxID=380675 RepID=A0A2N7VV63_9BURK|nr:hypothetical protein C0Z19_19285 [Trinickia soli]
MLTLGYTCMPGVSRSDSSDSSAKRAADCTVNAIQDVVSHWIHISTHAYDEYTFVPWLNRSVFRRTVDLSQICIQ